MLALDGTTFAAALVYYALAALSICACLASYVVLLRRPFTQYWIAKAETAAAAGDARQGTGAGDDQGYDEGALAVGGGSGGGPVSDYDVDAEGGAAPGGPGGGKRLAPDEVALVASGGGGGSAAASGGAGVTVLGVARAVWLEGLVVWLVFAVSFTVFPGIAPFHLDFAGPKSGGFSDIWWQQVRRVPMVAVR